MPQKTGLTKLFATPLGTALPVVRPLPLTTRGRVEFTVKCPACAGFHRHVHAGRATAPCGAVYVIRSRTAEKRAAAGGAS